MSQPPHAKTPRKGLFFFFFLLTAVAITGIVVSGILLFEKKTTPPSQDTLASEAEETLQQTDDDQNLSNLISVALSTKQYNILIQNLAPIITFEVTDTDCCGQISVSEVIKNLGILNESQGPWTFEKEPLDGKEVTMIGTSANDYLFGYTLDDKNRIKAIAISRPVPQAPIPTPSPEVQGIASSSAENAEISE